VASAEVSLSNGQTSLSVPAAVTLAFPDADGDGIVDGTELPATGLVMFSAPSSAGPWTADQASVVDLAGRKVSGSTSHFSYFALFYPSSADIRSARAYPNPWKPGTGGVFDAAGITFGNLTATAEIKIFTITGGLVRTLDVTAADAGTRVWDGRNSDGRKAASGVYLAHIKSGGSSKTLKIAVER